VPYIPLTPAWTPPRLWVGSILGRMPRKKPQPKPAGAAPAVSYASRLAGAGERAARGAVHNARARMDEALHRRAHASGGRGNRQYLRSQQPGSPRSETMSARGSGCWFENGGGLGKEFHSKREPRTSGARAEIGICTTTHSSTTQVVRPG